MLPYILIVVNIDELRYDPAMARSKTTLIDPDVQLLQALGHPTRLAIVRELTGTSEVCACDFTSCCDVGQPTVSHHLRILKEAGVISAERRGTSIFYRIVPSAADRLRSLAGELLGAPRLIPVGALTRTTARAARDATV
jgi:ArsR family transcriptional regulator